MKWRIAFELVSVLGSLTAGALSLPSSAVAGEGAVQGASPASVVTLMKKELQGTPGKEVEMLTVEYPPGGASAPHQHHAQVFVYVLSGTLRMQVKGGTEKILAPGDTFYESPDDIHVVSANASSSAPAKFLVLMVKDSKSGGTKSTETP